MLPHCFSGNLHIYIDNIFHTIVFYVFIALSCFYLCLSANTWTHTVCPLFLQIVFLFWLLFWTLKILPKLNCLILIHRSWGSVLHFPSPKRNFFSSCFIFVNYYCCVFRFTDLFFCSFQSAVNVVLSTFLFWIFYLSSVEVWLWSFMYVCVHIYIYMYIHMFHFSLHYVHIFLYILECTCNNCLKVLMC